MSGWNVTISKVAKKKLKKLKSSQVPNRYITFIEEVERSKDPARLGQRKTGRYRHCFGCHLTKSVTLIFTLSHKDRTVYILDIGDHKELYMRDNRA